MSLTALDVKGKERGQIGERRTIPRSSGPHGISRYAAWSPWPSSLRGLFEHAKKESTGMRGALRAVAGTPEATTMHVQECSQGRGNSEIVSHIIGHGERCLLRDRSWLVFSQAPLR
jgi:hypothetical protein